MSMTIDIRDKEIDEKCNICENDYKEYYVENRRYGIIPVVPMHVIQIGAVLICKDCFKEASLCLFDKCELEQLIEQKREENNLNEKPAHKRKIITKSLALKTFDRDGYMCLVCKSRKNLTADHVIPVSKGGKTELNNLQTLCQPCNSKKGTKEIDYR